MDVAGHEPLQPTGSASSLAGAAKNTSAGPGHAGDNANRPAVRLNFYQFNNNRDSNQISLNDKDQQVLIVRCVLG